MGTPSSPIDHPLFTGSLFLHSNDVVDPGKLKEGVSVTFYLYSDPQGLGAEECEIEDEVDEPSGGDVPLPPASPSTDTSGVLKATPKASAAAKATGDPDLAKKMAEKPELAR